MCAILVATWRTSGLWRLSSRWIKWWTLRANLRLETVPVIFLNDKGRKDQRNMERKEKMCLSYVLILWYCLRLHLKINNCFYNKLFLQVAFNPQCQTEDRTSYLVHQSNSWKYHHHLIKSSLSCREQIPSQENGKQLELKEQKSVQMT